MYETITYEVKDGIGYLTINRPKVLNAMNSTLLRELQTCLDQDITPDDDVNVIIITGAGRAFIAGADISEMRDFDSLAAYKFAEAGHNLMNMMERSPKIFIAAVNGYALGGGFEFCQACDFRIASTNAVFGHPETGLGIIPGFGGTVRLSRLVGKGNALFRILTAENFKADEAYRIGLVQKLVEPDELMKEAERVAKKINSNGPIGVAQAKQCVNLNLDTDIQTASRLEMEAWSVTYSTKDQKEGMTAFLEKRKPKFTGK